MLPKSPKTKSTTVASNTMGMSKIREILRTASGTMVAESPKMIRTFRILLPTTFPTAISALPTIAEEILTAASGAEVPIATIVRPITSCGIPAFVATLALPSTNTSAPLDNNTKPKANNNTYNKISYHITTP